MNVNFLQPKLVFLLVRGAMMVYMLSNISRKSHASHTEHCIPLIRDSQEHMILSIQTSTSPPLENAFQSLAQLTKNDV